MMDAVLHTPRLVLRPFTPDDAGAVARLLNDRDVNTGLTLVPHPYTFEDAKTFIAGPAAAPGTWAVTYERALIGCISITGTLGYWFGKAHWGKGFASEAARAVLAKHFAISEADVLSGYHAGNNASRHVLGKLGFVPRGSDWIDTVSHPAPVLLHRMTLSRAAWQAAA